MSDRMSWTDAELDRALEAYFGMGADTPTDRVAEAALLQVATTPQEGTRLTRLWSTLTASPALSWTAAVVVALAVAIGLLASLRPVGDLDPSPTPTAAPSGTPNPDALVPFRSDADGYELLIPSGWVEVPSEFDDARTWAGDDGELMISYGTSIFDGGNVTVCAPPLPSYNTCMPLEHGYSIPFNPAVDGVGPISMEGWLDRCDGGCPVTTSDALLGGEAASMDRAVISDRQLTYVATFHDRRPIVLYWSEPLALADQSRIASMVASFQFLDPSASQEPFVDPTELVPFGGAELGYEILVPRVWAESAGSPEPGVTTFGSGAGFGTEGLPALTISLGDPDGRVTLCQPSCELIVATTLDQVQDALVSMMARTAGSPGWPRLAHGDVVLGGESGRFERPDYLRRGDPESVGLRPRFGESNGCLGCPDMRYQLYVIHDGRPLVLTFDFWTVAFEVISYDYFLEITRSFRFVD